MKFVSITIGKHSICGKLLVTLSQLQFGKLLASEVAVWTEVFGRVDEDDEEKSLARCDYVMRKS